MQHVHPFQVKSSKRAEDDGGCMTWDVDMRIFGAWTPPSGIQTDTHSYATGPNYRDKIIETDDVKSLLQSVAVGLRSGACGRCRNGKTTAIREVQREAQPRPTKA